MYAPYKNPSSGGGAGRSNAPPGSPLGSPGRQAPPASPPQRGYASPNDPSGGTSPDDSYQRRVAGRGINAAPSRVLGRAMPFIGFALAIGSAYLNRQFGKDGFMPTSNWNLYGYDLKSTCGGNNLVILASTNANTNCASEVITKANFQTLQANYKTGFLGGPWPYLLGKKQWTHRSATQWDVLQANEYIRTVGVPNSQVIVAKYGMPQTLPLSTQIMASVLPMAQPLGQPLGQPLPTPLSLRPLTDTLNRPLPEGHSRVGPSALPHPAHPDNRGRIRPWPRPPGRGTKDKKGRIGRALLPLLNGALNAVTEGVDLAEALWKALPRKYRSSKKNMFQDLYKNGQHINVNNAIANIIKNEIGDQIVGRVAGPMNRAFRNRGLSGVGWYRYGM